MKYCKRPMKNTNTVKTKPCESPCGTLLLGAYGKKLCLCDWVTGKHHQLVIKRLKRILHADFEEDNSPVLREASEQLNEFFNARRKKFDIPLLLIGTPFQKTVWEELLKIPFGKTITYGETARRIGSPKAIRATANAIGANPLSVFIPCHRVIGNNHSLTGYGGGLDIKRILLKTECHYLPGFDF